ncbi:MAG: menaquinone biosynthesis decarboxylase [Armatimonadota bacterium]
MHKDLREFIDRLEAEGELRRIAHPVDPVLEITEVSDRFVKSGGPALFFERPTGYGIPVLTNAFASEKRMALAIGDPNETAHEIAELVRMAPPVGMVEKLSALPKLARLASYAPHTVRNGACQEVEGSLSELPVLTCWPDDGGPFITLPMVFTKHPETGARNVGMYRMHVYDAETTGMHWHPTKVGAAHYAAHERLGIRMDVAVALGGDPALTYAATAPLPEEFDEMIFAGFLRKKAVPMVRCKTVDIEVPADCEIVIEGYVEPGERRTEGPFGDHTGYYSEAAEFPVFHVTAVTRRKDAVYPATVVGRPPMEDCFMAKATERIFLPLMKMQLPEVVEMNLPIEGVFHNLAIVSIEKRYPGHARKVMHALWGMGQMSTTKILVILDANVDVHDISEVLWRLGNNVDPERDVEVVRGPVDILDHASPRFGYGSKMGIDATRKIPGEDARPWPDEIRMSEEVRARIDAIWSEL